MQITEVFLFIFMNFVDVGKPLFIMRFLIFPISCCFESLDFIVRKPLLCVCFLEVMDFEVRKPLLFL